jgi:hypothetical protein
MIANARRKLEVGTSPSNDFLLSQSCAGLQSGAYYVPGTQRVRSRPGQVASRAEGNRSRRPRTQHPREGGREVLLRRGARYLGLPTCAFSFNFFTIRQWIALSIKPWISTSSAACTLAGLLGSRQAAGKYTPVSSHTDCIYLLSRQNCT